MSRTLIIYCHPYDKSYNHAVMSRVIETLQARSEDYELIDLYADRFDPTYSAEELELYASGQTRDPLVSTYLAAVKRATRLVIIAPIWWNDIPATLKGFFDKVMKKGVDKAYTSTKFGLHGNLGTIRSAIILTTSTSPTFYLKIFCGNAIKRVFINATLKQLGITRVRWRNLGGITSSTESTRSDFLAKAASTIARY